MLMKDGFEFRENLCLKSQPIIASPVARPSRMTRTLLAFLLLLLVSMTHSKRPSNPTVNSQPGSLQGVVEKTIPIRQHTLYAPYVDSDLQNRWFDFGGSAIVDTNKHIRLTQDRSHESGWLWSRTPIGVNQFEIEFEFAVDGKGNALYGDGFAVWLTSERAIPGPVFGSKDYWNGIGIFFDTYANSRHPYSFPAISIFSNDGSMVYEVAKDGGNKELARCSIDFRRSTVSTKARLTYVRDKFLQLQIQYAEWDQWTPCFLIHDITIPTSPFLGFTAHTGQVSDNHDIVSVSTYSIVYHPLTKEQMAARQGIPARTLSFSRNISNLFSLIFRVVKWGVIVALLVVAGVAARKWKSSRDAKRF